MRAELERIREPAYCLRLWTDPAHGYGDPYQWAATARLIDDDSLEIMGVCAPITGEMADAIKAAAALHGAMRVGTRRIKPDRQWMRWHRTTPKPTKTANR